MASTIVENMKPLKKILDTLRSFPENTRRILAGGLLVFAAVIIFISWSSSISGRFGAIALDSKEIINDFSKTKKDVPPTQGLTESLKQAAQIVPRPSLNKNDLYVSFRKLINGIDYLISRLSNF